MGVGSMLTSILFVLASVFNLFINYSVCICNRSLEDDEENVIHISLLDSWT